jgi:hypothetical protein
VVRLQSEAGIILFTLGPTKPPIRDINPLSAAVKRPKREAITHLNLVKRLMPGVYRQSPIHHHGVIRKHRDNFILPFLVTKIIRNVFS